MTWQRIGMKKQSGGLSNSCVAFRMAPYFSRSDRSMDFGSSKDGSLIKTMPTFQVVISFAARLHGFVMWTSLSLDFMG